MSLVEVFREIVEYVDFGAADGIFVEGVVANRHYHGEDCEALVGGGGRGGGGCGGGLSWAVFVGGWEEEGCVAKVDSRGGFGDPGGF